MRTPVARLRLLGVLFACVALLFGLRLSWLQVVKASYFAEEAESQYKSSNGYSPYNRGSVSFTDRVGTSLSAAGLGTGYLLALNPKIITDPNSLYTSLQPYITVSQDEFVSKASKSSDPYEEIEHRLTPEVADKIRELDQAGVLLVREQWRYYPAGELAAHVLGFVGYNGDKLEGRYGVEQEYEDVLVRGKEDLYSNFFSDLFLGVKERVFDSGKAHAADVTLTIEPHVQALLESKLASLMEEWHASSAGGVIIDPTTGEIVAMSSLPTFDPNTYGDVTDSSIYANPLVEDVYELGSIMKPITIAAGIDSGKITADTTYLDKGFIELDGKRIQNYDGKGRGVASMQDVLNQSLNTGATHAALAMGRVTYREYLDRFGFSQKSGIDLPGEALNLIGNLEGGQDVEYATASFGQGIAVSPITMIRALSALGNGGYLIKPHVTKSLDYELGFTEERERIEQGRAISRESSEEITRMLVKVVDEYLIKGGLKLEHYSIAAKTGTAQIANPNGGGYYADRYLHSFFGYFPAYQPRFLVFLYMREPQGVQYASETLAHPFGDLANFLISYYEIPPDR